MPPLALPMFFPPVIERELKIALRRNAAVKSRFRTAAIATGITALFLIFGWLTGLRKSGSTLHQLLFYAGLYLAVFPPFQISVGLFSDERRNPTLELLYLTRIGSGALFLRQ